MGSVTCEMLPKLSPREVNQEILAKNSSCRTRPARCEASSPARGRRCGRPDNRYSLAINGRRPAGEPYIPPNPGDGLGRASSLSWYCTVDKTNKNRLTPPGGRT